MVIFSYSAVLLLLVPTTFVRKLLLLTRGLVKIFLKVTMLSGENKIKNERGSNDDTYIVPLLLIMFYYYVFLLLFFVDAVLK